MALAIGVFTCWRNPLLREKLLLSLKEFSVLTGLSPRTTSKLVCLQEVGSIRVGRRRLIPRAELTRFILSDHPTTAVLDAASRKKVGL